MHQNYGGGPRPTNMPPNMQQQPRLMSHLFNMPPNQQGGPNNMNNMPPQTAAQFNQRLVQEIQQNHPMLAFNRNAPPPMFHNNHHMNGNNNNNNNHGHQQQQQRFQINGHMVSIFNNSSNFKY